MKQQRLVWWLMFAVIGSGLLLHASYLHAKAWLAQQLLEHAWQESVQDGTTVKPWPWADTWPLARLRIPSQQRDYIVLAGASGRTLAFGPGHITGTAMPGQAGVAVVSGHRDTHFRFLQTLHEDALLQVQDQHGVWRDYRVMDRRIVHADQVRLASVADESVLVLVTCYPFDGVMPNTPLRYVVTARQVGPSTRGGILLAHQ